MRGFFAALISGTVVFAGNKLGFPMLDDFAAGVLIGSVASGPVTTFMWDDSHKKRKKITK
jgi:hypothetical protein